MSHSGDLLHRLTALFVDSKLVPLTVLFALLLGVVAVLSTPSEEEPQIVVPMIDIEVSMPGASPREVEQRVVGPMEKLLWEIPGVEYVYSTAMDGAAMSIVRFTVGSNPEESLIKTYAKLYQHLDWIPPGCSMPLVKPRSIDDVPVVAVSLTSPHRTPASLRHMALEAAEAVRRIPGVSEVSIIGGERRGITVEPDPEKLRLFGIDLAQVAEELQAHNQAEVTGHLHGAGVSRPVRLWSALASASEVRRVVVAVHHGKPVYLEDVAEVRDGPLEPEHYVFFAAGPGKAAKGIGLAPGELAPGRDPHRGQAHRRERHPHQPPSPTPRALPGGKRPACGCRGRGGAGLRCNRPPQVRRTPLPSGAGDPECRGYRGPVFGPAGELRGHGGRARHLGHHPGHVLAPRLHPQPRHSLCPHLLHRHPGGRPHRGRGKHRPPPQAAPVPGQRPLGDHRGRGLGGARPLGARHLHRHRRHHAHGLRARPHGPLHAAHACGRQHRHAALHGGGLRDHPMARQTLFGPRGGAHRTLQRPPHPALRRFHAPAHPPSPGSGRLSRHRGGALPPGRGHVSAALGAGEDAPLRQQERTGARHRHARRHGPGRDHGRSRGHLPGSAGGPGGDGHPALRGYCRALHLQWAGASLLWPQREP